MLPKFFLNRLKSRLLLRLFVYVVISSLFFSLLASAVQLFMSYRRDVQSIHQNIQFIRDSYLPPLANSVFNLNEEQIRLQLKSLLRFSDIVYLQVSDTTAAKTVELAENQTAVVSVVLEIGPAELEILSVSASRYILTL